MKHARSHEHATSGGGAPRSRESGLRAKLVVPASAQVASADTPGDARDDGRDETSFFEPTAEIDLTPVARSLDLDAALRQLVRIVAGHVACGCVAHLTVGDEVASAAHVPSRSGPALAAALDPLVAHVRATGMTMRATRATRTPKGATPAAPPATSSPIVENARRALDMDWLVCVPLPIAPDAPAGATAGMLSVCGMYARHPPLSATLAEELASRAAAALENARLHAAAVIALRDREQMLGMVSHDLKNPLSVITMTVAHLLETAPAVDRRQRGRRHLEVIQRSARRAMQLVGDLLDVTVIDSGHLVLEPERLDVAKLVADTLADLGGLAASAGVSLDAVVAEGLPHAWADERRMLQVLSNLVSNAIKFTPAGGRITVRVDARDDAVVVRVVDTGIGIRPEDVPHVFDRFWQSGDAQQKLGSGLGLAICKCLVEHSGGTIDVKSVRGGPSSGTTMRFTLPIAPDPDGPASSRRPAPSQVPPQSAAPVSSRRPVS